MGGSVIVLSIYNFGPRMGWVVNATRPFCPREIPGWPARCIGAWMGFYKKYFRSIRVEKNICDDCHYYSDDRHLPRNIHQWTTQM